MIRAQSLTVLQGEPHARATVTVPNPTLPPSRHPWTLMALIEIDSQERKTDAILASMMSEIHARYESSHAATGEEALTDTCRKFNENANLLTRKNQAWYKRLHIALAVIDGNALSLALFGNVRTYLSHKGKLIDIQGNARPESTRSARGQFKIFTSLLAGRMVTGDKFFLSCPHLFDYFSTERIQTLLSEKSAPEISQYLTRMLKGLPGSVSVAAAVAEAVPEKVLERAVRPTISANQSIAELNTLQDRTAQLLTGSFAKNVKRLAQHAKPPPDTARPASPEKNDSWKKEMRERVIAAAKQIMHFLAVRARALFHALRPARARDTEGAIVTEGSVRKPPPAWRIALQNILARFRRLPRSSQYLLIGSILLALLFIESIVSIANQRIRTQEREAFSAGAAQVEQMLNEAEASLIYGDEEHARSIWSNASAEFTGLKARASEEKQKQENLSTRLHDLQTQVFRLRVVDNPEGLVNLAQFSEDGFPPALGGLIGPSAEFILSFSSQGSTVFIIQPSSKSVTVATPDNPEALSLIRGTAGDNGIFYFVTSDGFVRFNARTNTYSTLAADAPPQDIADLAVYGQRLYALNRARGSIERYDFTEGGLTTPSSWFEAGTTLPGATSLAIDGSIYVADASGALRKFTRGIEQDFRVGAIEPPLRTPTRLAADTNYLYILEPAERRVVILNKDGTLKEQITSPVFDRLIDMAVNPSRRLIYLLSGTVVYSVPFPL